MVPVGGAAPLGVGWELGVGCGGGYCAQ